MIRKYVLICTAFVAAYAAPLPTASIVVEGTPGAPARHGIAAVRDALTAKGWSVKEVRNEAQAKGGLVVFAASDTALGPEAISIHKETWQGKPAVRILGGDDRGLMYGLLDVADRIGWATSGADVLADVREASEKPAVSVRGLSIYTMNAAYFQSHLYNEDYWTKYFDMLARDRFNTFVVIFGYENAGYFAPAYPYFFDVDGFPNVHVVGLTKEQQKRNQDALRRMITLAHERGLKFSVGLWDHIYRGGVQGPAALAEHPTPGLVWGLKTENLITYIPAAFEKFLQVYPDIDVVQFRMHSESGLKPSEMRDFWEKMYGVMQQAPKHVTFEFRLKEFPDDLIDRAVQLKLNFRLETKYWAEQMGMPFHPTHIQRGNQFDRRHGYADVLRYPQTYNVGYRLWNGGTARILLWGSPDYARRFAQSTLVYNGPGYEVNEPLATKMERAPTDVAPFDLLNEPYRYYKYEFERYWHFYQSFGRMGYDADTPTDIWDHEFKTRFGETAGPLIEDGLHRASWILPRIVAYCLPGSSFPTTRGWAEKQPWGDLPTYTASTPSDTQQFASFEEAAECRLTGHCTAKISPMKTSQWFEQTASAVLADAAKAEQATGSQTNKELFSTVTDLRILSSLAQYHARRIPAAVSLALFNRTHDVNMLDDALTHERAAVAAWEGIVKAAGDVYVSNLRMGMEEYDLTGTWKDELPKLQAGIAALERQRAAFQVEARRPVGKFVFGNTPAKEGERRLTGRSTASIPLPNGWYEVTFTIDGSSAPAAGYGPMWVAANGTAYSDTFHVAHGQTVERKLIAQVGDGQLHVVFGADASGTYHVDRMSVSRVDPVIATVPVAKIEPERPLVVRATVSGISPISTVRVHFGDASRGYRVAEMRKLDSFRYSAQLPAMPSGRMNYWIEAIDDAGLASTYPEGGAADPIHVTITSDDAPPMISHEPVKHLAAGDAVRITATVTDESGIRWVHVRYRGMNQWQDYRSLPLLPTGEKNQYSAEIPASQIDPKWDFMYFIEAMDSAGNGTIYPNLNQETPYIVVKLDRENWKPKAVSVVPAE
ncbi:MAG TPA: hypothetical protein VG675_15240 [Bryobacteraceae bacterium]|nr:hypothetical protein [Bryobacteraceae bacterium]